MTHESTPELSKLFAALAKCQFEIQAVSKSQDNPFYKSKYATLDNLIESSREILYQNGLGLIQFPISTKDTIGLKNILVHSSGQSLTCRFEICNTSTIQVRFDKKSNTTQKIVDPQKVGALITYLRRYSFSAIFKIASEEDDDGNSLVAPPRQNGNNRQDNRPRQNPLAKSPPRNPDPKHMEEVFTLVSQIPKGEKRLLAHLGQKFKREFDSLSALDFDAAIYSIGFLKHYVKKQIAESAKKAEEQARQEKRAKLEKEKREKEEALEKESLTADNIVNSFNEAHGTDYK